TLRNSGADVFAASVPFLTKVAAEVPGSRIVGPPFAVAPVMIAVSPGRTAALGYIRDFIREVKTTGLIQQAINRAKLPSGPVAPPGGSPCNSAARLRALHRPAAGIRVAPLSLPTREPSHVLPCRAHATHQAVADHRHVRQGEGAEGGREGRDRP